MLLSLSSSYAVVAAGAMGVTADATTDVAAALTASGLSCCYAAVAAIDLAADAAST